MLYDFLDMANNYRERKVDRYEQCEILVDTALVNDAEKPYETAIEHPMYNDRIMIIVEYYDTKEDAQNGHDRWVELLTGNNLPDVITDVSTAETAKLLDSLENDRLKKFQRKE